MTIKTSDLILIILSIIIFFVFVVPRFVELRSDNVLIREVEK